MWLLSADHVNVETDEVVRSVHARDLRLNRDILTFYVSAVLLVLDENLSTTLTTIVDEGSPGKRNPTRGTLFTSCASTPTGAARLPGQSRRRDGPFFGPPAGAMLAPGESADKRGNRHFDAGGRYHSSRSRSSPLPGRGVKWPNGEGAR